MTQLEIQALADAPTGIYQDLEEQLMSNIIQHIQDYGEPIATDTWSMQKLAEIGKLTEENIKIIAKTTGSSATAMERMLTEVAEEAISKVDTALQYSVNQGLVGSAIEVSQSKNITSVVDTLLGQADSIINLCNTNMLYKATEKYTGLISNITSTANEILSKYTTLAVTGAESRQSALTKCIKAFNDKGIPAFVDSAGREWTPEAYVNMCMRSTSNTMAAEAQMARCDDYEIDLVEVDSHSGARPKCARDQGKIFDRANKSEVYPHWKDSSYGEPDGLLGINCGHHIYPFIDGVSIRRNYPTEDLEANDKLYKETQTQRALERDVRKQKRECMLYDQLGDEDAFQTAAVKLKQKEANLKSYVNSNDELTYRSNRVQVVGYDKSVSASAVAANKAYTKAQNTDTISIKDTVIYKSVGAKAKNYSVIDKSTGIEYEFAPGTKIQNSQIFAGKGVKTNLHEGVAEGLADEFGGSISGWQHAKGNAVLVETDTETSEEYKAEVHWFQESSVGKVKFKVKEWLDDES